jgi:hypothetical protein
MKSNDEKRERIKKQIKEKERLYARSQKMSDKYLDEIDRLWERLDDIP